MKFFKQKSLSLSAKTDNILGVFNKTMDKLSKVKEKAEQRAIEEQKKIDEAQIEKSKLEKVSRRASAVITKLTSFISITDEDEVVAETETTEGA